jgi:hypothetical protein
MNLKSNLLLFAVLGTCLLTGCKDCDNGDKVIFWADCAPSPGPNIPETAIIVEDSEFNQDVVWKNGPGKVDYLLKGDVTFTKTLTVEPGTVISAEAGVGIGFEGAQAALIARGTANQPILFQSKTGLKGGWRGMYFKGSENPLNELRYVTIQDGGSDATIKSNLRFYDSNQMRMSHCTIRNSQAYGLVEAASSTLTLKEFEHNSFQDNSDYPLLLHGETVKDIGNTSVIAANAKNFIALQDDRDLTGTHVWKKQTAPYYWSEPRSLDVGNSSTGSLTLEAGVTLEMSPGSSIIVEDNSSSLTLAGTTDDKVRIVGNIRQAGAWQGILIDTPSMNNMFTHAVISHGGATGLDGNANVVLGRSKYSDSRLVLNNVELSNSAGCGINQVNNRSNVLISEGVTYSGNAGGDACPR